MIEIRNSNLDDVMELIESIREEDKLEIIATGVDPFTALYNSYTHSIYRKTALVNGKVSAMWGVCGDLFGPVGQPYLVTGKSCLEIPTIKFVKIYIEEVKQMKILFPTLENYVDIRYTGACRMLQIAGFKLDKPVLVGTDEVLFSKFHD